MAMTLVMSDTLTLARANRREIGCDTEAMSDRAISAHPSIVALALIRGHARTATGTNGRSVALHTITLDRVQLLDVPVIVTNENIVTPIGGVGNTVRPVFSLCCQNVTIVLGTTIKTTSNYGHEALVIHFQNSIRYDPYWSATSSSPDGVNAIPVGVFNITSVAGPSCRSPPPATV